jgi:hypothetical protein
VTAVAGRAPDAEEEEAAAAGAHASENIGDGIDFVSVELVHDGRRLQQVLFAKRHGLTSKLA